MKGANIRMRKCSVKGCVALGSETKLFGFPNPAKDRDRYLEWVASTGDETLVTMDQRHVYLNRQICENHFSELQHVNSNPAGRLKTSAIPDAALRPEKTAQPMKFTNMPSIPVKNVKLIESNKILEMIVKSNQSGLKKKAVTNVIGIVDNQQNLLQESNKITEKNLKGNSSEMKNIGIIKMVETQQPNSESNGTEKKANSSSIINTGMKNNAVVLLNTQLPNSVLKQGDAKEKVLFPKPTCEYIILNATGPKLPLQPLYAVKLDNIGVNIQPSSIVRAIPASSIVPGASPGGVQKCKAKEQPADEPQKLVVCNDVMVKESYKKTRHGETRIVKKLKVMTEENGEKGPAFFQLLVSDKDKTLDINKSVVKSSKSTSYTNPRKDVLGLLPEETNIVQKNKQKLSESEKKQNRVRKSLLIRKRLLYDLGIRSTESFKPKARKIFKDLLFMRLLLLNSRKSLKYFRKKSFEEKILIVKRLVRHIKDEKLGNLLLKHLKVNHRKYVYSDLDLISCQAFIKKYGIGTYSFISHLLNLPNKILIRKMAAKIGLNPGVNNVIIDYLKEVVTAHVTGLDKYCIISLEEIALSTEFGFQNKRDAIIGFMDLGSDRRSKIFADKALVFVVRGISKKYYVPISFAFCSSNMEHYNLPILIQEVIQAVLSTGLIVVATMCDQSKEYVAAINTLVKESSVNENTEGKNCKEGDYFIVHGRKIRIMFNFNSMLLGVRNDLLDFNIEFKDGDEVKTAKWEHVEVAYKYDNSRTPNICGKLTDDHIFKDKINTNNLVHCVQVFSSTFSSFLSSVAGHPRFGDALGIEATETSDLLYFMDKLYDSVSGSSVNLIDGKLLKCAITNTSGHLTFWKVAIEILENMFLIHSDNGSKSRSISLENWPRTLRNMRFLYKALKKQGLTSLLPRNLSKCIFKTQYSSLKRKLGIKMKPNVSTFITIYKNLLIKNLQLLHNINGNCEKFDPNYISSLIQRNEEISVNSFDLIVILDSEEVPKYQINENELKDIVIIYVAGVILNKVLEKVEYCEWCILKNTTKCDKSSHALIIKRKKLYKNYLEYFPNQTFIKSYVDAKTIILNILPDICHRPFLTQSLKLSVTLNGNFNKGIEVGCPLHSAKAKDIFLNIVIKMHINDWCRCANKFFVGKFSKNDYNNCKDPIWKAAADFFSMKTEGIR